jgi:hypothetical protein
MVTESRELGVALHDAAQDLSSYDMQQQLAALRGLEEKIAKRREELAPRAKFSFKRKPKAEVQRAAPDAAAASKDVASSLASASTVPNDAVVIDGQKGSKLVITPGGRDVMLKDLTDCDVHLLDVVGAVRANNVVRCRIWAPAVASSLLLYNCDESVFVLVAQQLRLHDSHRLSLYLHTKSSPVIEGCTDVKFGPYPADAVYPEREANWKAIGLEPTTDDRTWAQVLDFHWHKTTPSPNWTLTESAPAAQVLQLDASAPSGSDGAA